MSVPSPVVLKCHVIILVAIFAGFTGIAQPTALSIFATDEIPEAVLETDMRLLVKNKFREEYQPAILKMVRAKGDTTHYSVEIRSRGNVRKEVCYYPPFFMRFSKGDFSYHKLKWVNVCRDTDVNEEYLLKEHIAYSIFRMLTDMSFKSHLIHVTYVDTGGKNKPMTRYAFVLQDEDELAEAYGGRIIEATSFNSEFLNPHQLATFSFFQYMIGNTDWAFGNAHNVKVFTHPETNTLIPVAYDFDYSGFVNTTYAIPHESMPIDKVTERHNKCDCITEEICESMRLHVLSKKEAILSFIEAHPGLNRKAKNDCISYLEPFFTTLEDSKQTWRVFVRNCRTR